MDYDHDGDDDFLDALQSLDFLAFTKRRQSFVLPPPPKLTIDDLSKFAFTPSEEEPCTSIRCGINDISFDAQQQQPSVKKEASSMTKKRKRNACDNWSSSLEQDLYVMTSSAFPGLVKVGRSNQPERRRLDLSNGQPANYTLDVVFHGAGQHEQAVHKKLSALRHTEGHSREWFACTPDDVIEAFRVIAPEKIEQIERKTVQMILFDEE